MASLKYMKFLIPKISHLLILFMLSLLVACSSGSGESSTKSNTETFTVSGTILIDSKSDIDIDVMSFGSLTEENNQIETPQFLSNPVTLGGYLSGNAGSYTASASNDSFYYKDTQDFYRVVLLKGQQIRLTTFLANEKLTNININFALHAADDQSNESDEEPEPLNFSSAKSQSLTATRDGVFIIELSAEEDLSAPVLYTLSISQSLTFTSAASNYIAGVSSKFVPGEVVVKFKDPTQVQALHIKQDSLTLLENKHQLLRKKNIGNIGTVYKIDTKSARKTIAFEENLIGTAQAFDLNTKWQTLNAIEQLNLDERVLYAEPNYIFEASSLPARVNDPGFSRQWGLAMLDAPAAWEVSTGVGVIVAVIDTGIDTNHLDLINNINLTDGYDFISDDASAGDDDSGADENPYDTGTFFHGSHVAGIIAAEGNNSIGVAGVAYDTTIMPLRVLGIDNKGTNSDIADAILYAAGIPDSRGLRPDKKADIINLSLGGTDKPQVLEDAINAALAEGVIVIAAAGNDSSMTPHYPAAFEGVIAVSAVNDHKTLSTFSNYGSHIAVTAPGGTGANSALLDGFQDGILSTLFANEYAEYSGTSMATPHVSAVAALMKSISADLDTTSFSEALRSGALTESLLNRDFYTENNRNSNREIYKERYGYGLINAAKSVNWALATESENLLPASLSIFPTQLGFVNENTESTLELNNTGSGDLTITGISTTNDWIEVSEFHSESVDNFSHLGKYRVKVNNIGLTDNSVNSGEIVIAFAINGEPQEPITIDVFNSSTQQTDSSVGTLLVSLSHIDESDPEKSLVQFALVEALKGEDQYTYKFHNVPNGEYLLQAGTDNDLDLDILDAGEARGQYPPFAQTDFINVNNENLSDLDFSVKYQSFSQPSSVNTQKTSPYKSIGSTEKFR